MSNPHQITKDFEEELCRYTGAKYAVAVNSCTMALFLALKWAKACDYIIPDSLTSYVLETVDIPKFTYNSVPMVAMQAGLKVNFTDQEWKGEYLLFPSRVWDAARRFTSGMYRPGSFQCVSFHATKILGDSQGGAILHDNTEADAWFRRARFDGRTEGVPPKEDKFIMGWHCYLSPDVANRLLWKLYALPKDNPDLPNSDYADLSLQECFK
jgi:dTDP-4-amino-4,6-dideoxygalactose transaminase